MTVFLAATEIWWTGIFQRRDTFLTVLRWTPTFKLFQSRPLNVQPMFFCRRALNQTALAVLVLLKSSGSAQALFSWYRILCSVLLMLHAPHRVVVNSLFILVETCSWELDWHQLPGLCCETVTLIHKNSVLAHGRRSGALKQATIYQKIKYITTTFCVCWFVAFFLSQRFFFKTLLINWWELARLLSFSSPQVFSLDASQTNSECLTQSLWISP